MSCAAFCLQALAWEKRREPPVNRAALIPEDLYVQVGAR